MSEIERILLNGKSARDDEVTPVASDEIRAYEELLRLPPNQQANLTGKSYAAIVATHSPSSYPFR